MTPEYFSACTSDLVQALNLTEDTLPDWKSFADFLVQVTGADTVWVAITGPGLSNRVVSGEGADSAFTDTPLLSITEQELVAECGFQYSGQEACVLTSPENLMGPLSCVMRLGVSWEKQHRESEIAEQVLHSFRPAVLSLDIHGRVRQMNPCAGSMVQNGVMTFRQRHVQLTVSPQWIADHISGNESVSSLYFRHNDQGYQCALIREATGRSRLWDAPRFTLLIMPRQENICKSGLREMYSLTECEAGVVALYAQGNSAGDVAQKTGYTQHTVYSYIKKLYAGNGFSSQSQLSAAVWSELP